MDGPCYVSLAGISFGKDTVQPITQEKEFGFYSKCNRLEDFKQVSDVIWFLLSKDHSGLYVEGSLFGTGGEEGTPVSVEIQAGDDAGSEEVSWSLWSGLYST